MSLLIKGALWQGAPTDLYIEGGKISQVGPSLDLPADRIIQGAHKALIPGLINGHTHAAMTLFRGFGDDMALMPWLQQKIWPNEAKLTHEDIYWGAKLACLEMIKSGTTCFFDMYHDFEATAEAVEEMGIRGVLSGVCFDHFCPELAERCKELNRRLVSSMDRYSDRIRYALGPHAIYTVSGEFLQWIDRFSQEHDNALIHLHLAETEGEVENSVKQFGLTPVRYLHRLGILSPRLVLAHGIYIDSEEVQMLADHGVKVVHNPASNMKLASGICFRYDEMRQAGVKVGLGTDGCSSSNNLDMIEAMKLASLLGKAYWKNPEAVKAHDIFQSATCDGADILELHTGRIEPGYQADLCLIDLQQPAFTPNFDLISNLVYAANGSCVDTLICDGRVLMEHRHVPGEEEILEQAARRAYELVNRPAVK
ncbi:MAG: amidohydrolase family protein [Parabacteroides sp.]